MAGGKKKRVGKAHTGVALRVGTVLTESGARTAESPRAKRRTSSAVFPEAAAARTSSPNITCVPRLLQHRP